MIISLDDLKKKKKYKNVKSYSLYFRRQLKKDRLIRIENGLYATTDTPLLEIASNILYPSYISLWSASSYYGFTEQMPSIAQVMATKQKRQLNVSGINIKFIKCLPFWMYGYKRENSIFIASQEKLSVDCLKFQREMGNFDEILSVIRNAIIDENTVLDYLRKSNDIALIKRAGFILEKERSIDIYRFFKGDIAKDKNYARLNLFDKKTKEISSKWRVKY